MEPPAVFLLGVAFLQWVVAAHLAAHRGPGSRYLAAAFVLNGLVALASGAAVAAPAPDVDRLGRIADAPTGYLLAAFAAARYGARFRGAAPALAVLGALAGAVMAWGPLDAAVYAAVLHIPLYAAYAALVLLAARSGGAEDAWFALAFLPRGVHLATLNLSAPVPDPVVVAAAGLVGASVVATSWLASRGPRGFGPGAIGLFALGLVLAGAQLLGPRPAPPGADLVGLFSLTVVRAACVLAAIAPVRAVAAGLATSAAPALAAAGWDAWMVPGLGSAPLAGFLFSAGVGGFAFLFLALVGQRLLAAIPATPPAPAAPASGPVARGTRGRDGRPAWQRLVVALAGSSDPGLRPRVAWTQKALAASTATPIQRVSEFPDRLNEEAEAKLDAFVPGWRAQLGPGVPNLVERKRGAVEGAPGVHAYFRLTPAGEALAARLAGAAPGQASPGFRPESAAPAKPG